MKNELHPNRDLLRSPLRILFLLVIGQLFCFNLYANPINNAAKCNIYTDIDLKNFPFIENSSDHTFQLFSHAKPGTLFINGQWLEGEELHSFIKTLLNNGDFNQLNIYGCEFAKGLKGLSAIAQLEASLKVSISASDDITGIDGDWDLEVGAQIDALSVPYHGNLQPPATDSIAFVTGNDGTGTSGIGLSVWTLMPDSTFNRNEISFSGFDRDGTSSEVFGHSDEAQTIFADVTSDGLVDIVHITEIGGANNLTNAIYVWENNGDNTFNTNAISTTGFTDVSGGFAGVTATEQGWLVSVNTDTDNHLDYVYSGNDNMVHVFFGDGTGHFSLEADESSPLTVDDADGYRTSGINNGHHTFLEDVTGDGKPDLVMARQENIGLFDDTGKLIVWAGVGDGTFAAADVYEMDIDDTGTSNSTGSADDEFSSLADVDGDDDLDYIHVETYDGTNTIHSYLNDGSGVFATTPVPTTVTVLPIGGAGAFANYIGTQQSFFLDVNNDGLEDYVTTTEGGSAGLSVYFAQSGVGNEGEFSLTPVNTLIPTEFATGRNAFKTSDLIKNMFFVREICGNGIDDDGDGMTDCADPDCADNTLLCDSPPSPPAACTESVAYIHGADLDGVSDKGLSVWISNDDGTFNPEQIGYGGFERESSGSRVFGNQADAQTFTGDVNNDSYPDIVHVTEVGGNAIYVYLSNGDNTFKHKPEETTGLENATDGIFAGISGAEQGWLVDATGDNRLDYVFSGDDNKIHTYVGLGNGKFMESRITSILFDAGGYKTSGESDSEYFECIDVTGDGIADLIGTFDESGSGRMQIWKGLGNGKFDSNLHLSFVLDDSGSSNSSGRGNGLLGGEYSDFKDVDGDGDIDYIHVNNHNSQREIWTWLNDGSGVFSNDAASLIKSSGFDAPGGVAARFVNFSTTNQSFFADINKDGLLDYISAIQNVGLYVYLGLGGMDIGKFSTTVTPTPISDKFTSGTSADKTSFMTCGVIVEPDLACESDMRSAGASSVGVYNGNVVIAHGDDAGSELTYFISNNDGTFSTSKNSISGFLEDNNGDTEVFGFGVNESTHFIDVNNDGAIDIVHANDANATNNIHTYLNNGDNTFELEAIETLITSGTDNRVMAGWSNAEQSWMGDTNGDFYPDYIFSGNDGQIHTYRGLGNGSFAKTRITSCLDGVGDNQTSGVSVTEQFNIVDINRDNIVDLVGVYDNAGSVEMQAWLGYGDGRFTSMPDFTKTLNSAPTSLSTGSGDNEFSSFTDVNNDGYADYVHAFAANFKMEIWTYLNNAGNFAIDAVKTEVSAPAIGILGFANLSNDDHSFFADVNKDGFVDYITAYDYTNPGISVYLGLGDGKFEVDPINSDIPLLKTGSSGTESAAILSGLHFEMGSGPETIPAPDLCCNAGIVGPNVKQDTAVCGPTTIDLNGLQTSTTPPGTTLVWSLDGDGTPGSTIASNITAEGVYYAYYLGTNSSTLAACYSPPSAPVKVYFGCYLITADMNVVIDNMPISGDVSTNDVVPSGTTYSNPVAHGSNPSATLPVLNPDGTYTFTPDPTDPPGEYIFDIAVCPEGQTMNCPTEILKISSISSTLDGGPIVNNDETIMPMGGTLASIPVLSNDAALNGSDLGLPYFAGPVNTIMTSGGGTATVNADGTLSYTPLASFVGIDTVTYYVCDTLANPDLCGNALLFINVSDDPASTIILAVDDYVLTPIVPAAFGGTVSGKVAGGNLLDNDVNLTSVVPATTTTTGVGTIVILADGTYTFTPVADYTGPAVFKYTGLNGSNSSEASAYFTVAGDGAALPIDLISFTGQWDKNDAVLKWVTANEIDNDFFSIERSIDGVEFVEIGTVQAGPKENAEINYQFVDKSIKRTATKHVYYRLRQFDLDGKSELSKLVLLRIESIKKQYSIYPNPTNGNITFNTLLDADRIQVYNNIGMRVIDKQVNGSNNLTLNFSDQIPGLYNLILTDNNNVKHLIKFMISK